jgi:hypothetical protein
MNFTSITTIHNDGNAFIIDRIHKNACFFLSIQRYLELCFGRLFFVQEMMVYADFTDYEQIVKIERHTNNINKLIIKLEMILGEKLLIIIYKPIYDTVSNCKTLENKNVLEIINKDSPVYYFGTGSNIIYIYNVNNTHYELIETIDGISVLPIKVKK